MKSDIPRKRLETALLAALLLFAGCKDLFHPEGSENDDYTTTYRVTFFYDSYSHWDERDVSSGSSIGFLPGEPTRSGYAFDGWYASSDGGGSQFTASTVVNSDISVYAKWTAEPTAPVAYELTYNSGEDWENYAVVIDDFLPDGFAVHAGDQIEISFLIKTGAGVSGFSIGMADWANGGGWIATDWNAAKSVDADGRFHRRVWTLTAQASGPAGSNSLQIQFAAEIVGKSKITVYVGDVTVTNLPASGSMPSNLSLAESLTWISDNAEEGGVYSVALKNNETIAPKTLSYGKNVSVTLNGGASERTVSLNTTGSLFTVESGVTLTLGNNVTLRGRGDNEFNNYSSEIAVVNSGGKLIMKDGAKITGNISSVYGSGVGV
ncbi:MAG: InlB B-repeat-containing protein [Treponema sp.]|jgi:uncharacterized repeat protein (TIGR02543 family)|nr:InlB B-repeat-containing protein [Treponema sp.]